MNTLYNATGIDQVIKYDGVGYVIKAHDTFDVQSQLWQEYFRGQPTGVSVYSSAEDIAKFLADTYAHVGIVLIDKALFNSDDEYRLNVQKAGLKQALDDINDRILKINEMVENYPYNGRAPSHVKKVFDISKAHEEQLLAELQEVEKLIRSLKARQRLEEKQAAYFCEKCGKDYKVKVAFMKHKCKGGLTEENESDNAGE